MYSSEKGAIVEEAARLSAEYPKSTFQIKPYGEGFVIEREDGPVVEYVFDARVDATVARQDFIRNRMQDALVSVRGGRDRFGVEQKGNDDPNLRGFFQYENKQGKTVTRRLSMIEVTRMGMDLDTEGRKLPLGQRIARGVSEGIQAAEEGGKFRFQYDKLTRDTVVYEDKHRKVTWGQVYEGVKSAAKRETLVELGYYDVTPNTSRTVVFSLGDDAASDLPEDETTTTALNPFVEFTADILFADGGGDPAPSITDLDGDEALTSDQTAVALTGTGINDPTITIVQGSVTVGQTRTAWGSTRGGRAAEVWVG